MKEGKWIILVKPPGGVTATPEGCIQIGHGWRSWGNPEGVTYYSLDQAELAAAAANLNFGHRGFKYMTWRYA